MTRRSAARVSLAVLVASAVVGVAVLVHERSLVRGPQACELLSAADVRAVTGLDVQAGKAETSDSGPSYPIGCGFGSSSRAAQLSVQIWAMRENATTMYDNMSRVPGGASSTSGGYPHTSKFSGAEQPMQSTMLLKNGEYVNVLVWGNADLPHDTRLSDALAARVAARLG